jgi:hypothetical protein
MCIYHLQHVRGPILTLLHIRSPILRCGVLNGECSFLSFHLRMGCREETWVMVNTFKVDQARGTV